jgi:hypothetical protein
MPQPTLKEHVQSGQQQFRSLSSREQAYTTREIRVANGVSTGSSFRSPSKQER